VVLPYLEYPMDEILTLMANMGKTAIKRFRGVFREFHGVSDSLAHTANEQSKGPH